MAHVQTVVETAAFLAAAREAGMSDEERAAVVALVSEDPMHGQVMRGAGGCRKFRFPAPGRGKSGSYRIVTFYSGPRIPVFLLALFAKGEKDNLSPAERNALAALSERLKAYGQNL